MVPVILLAVIFAQVFVEGIIFNGSKFDHDKLRDNDDVSLKLLHVETFTIGQSADIIVNIENRSDKKRTVQFVLRADSMIYNGQVKKHLKLTDSDDAYKKTLHLAPRQSEIIKIPLLPEMYVGYLANFGNMRIEAVAIVAETDQWLLPRDDFTILMPKLSLDMPTVLRKGKPFSIKLSFTNPLSRELKNCVFRVSGDFKKEIQFRNVKPKEHVIQEIQLTPKNSGRLSVYAFFNSDLLFDMQDSKEANVV